MEAKTTPGTISLILTAGSKISLISKSERRYEGILYSLDLEEATISLQKVHSFGTEDRPTPRLVPPKGKVYEFANFCVADIKEIEILELPPPPEKEEEQQPNEEPIGPAIVEVQHYQAPPPIIGSSLEAVGGVTADHNNIHRNSYPNRVGGPMLGGKSLPQPPQQQRHHPQQFSLEVGFGSKPIGPPTVPPPQSSGSSSTPTATQRQQRPPKSPSPSSPDRNCAQQNRQQQPCALAPRGRGVQYPSPQQQQPQQLRLYSPNLPPRGDQDQRNGGYNNFGGYNRQPQNEQGNDESDDFQEYLRKYDMRLDWFKKFVGGVSTEIPRHPFKSNEE